jgi:hypothetical protein
VENIQSNGLLWDLEALDRPSRNASNPIHIYGTNSSKPIEMSGQDVAFQYNHGSGETGKKIGFHFPQILCIMNYQPNRDDQHSVTGTTTPCLSPQ